jgi:hypothetical protein
MLLHDGIESSIVLDEAELTILLLHEEDWGTKQWLQLPNSTSSEGLVQECVHLSLLSQCHQVDLPETR